MHCSIPLKDHQTCLVVRCTFTGLMLNTLASGLQLSVYFGRLRHCSVTLKEFETDTYIVHSFIEIPQLHCISRSPQYTDFIIAFSHGGRRAVIFTTNLCSTCSEQ